MGKAVSDAVLDAALNKIATATRLCVCSAQPTTYTEAITTFELADVTLSGGDFTIADDTSGRKVTVGAKTGFTVDVTGTATHVAVVDVSGTALLYVTTCTSQGLTAANTANTPAFKVNILDPT